MDEEAFNAAWEHHKANNPHHHEVAKAWSDIVHMVIDWTAMSYQLGGSAQSYYEENEGRINLSDEHRNFMYEIFDRLTSQRH